MAASNNTIEKRGKKGSSGPKVTVVRGRKERPHAHARNTMKGVAPKETKSVSINMRVAPSKQNLLSRAADVAGVDRTSFIMEAACRAAENVLLDQQFFAVDDETFTAVENILKSPLPKGSKLKSLLEKKAPWE